MNLSTDNLREIAETSSHSILTDVFHEVLSSLYTFGNDVSIDDLLSVKTVPSIHLM